MDNDFLMNDEQAEDSLFNPSQSQPFVETAVDTTAIAPFNSAVPSALGQLANAQSNTLGINHQMAQEQLQAKQEADKKKAQQELDELDKAESFQKQMQAENQALSTKIGELNAQKYEGFWSRKSTPTKILGIIAVGLGSLGASLSKSDNTAMKMLDKEMDDDFRNWQANQKLKMDQINAEKGSIRDKQEAYNDLLKTAQARRIVQYKMLDNQLTDISNKYSSPLMNAKIGELQAQVQVKIANETDKINQFTTSQTLRSQYTKALEKTRGNQLEFQKLTQMKGAFNNEQVVKDYKESEANLVSLKVLPNDAHGDYSRIFMFAKALDPRSVVKEGEQEMITKAGLSKLQGYGLDALRILSGDLKLTDAQRKSIDNVMTKTLVARRDEIIIPLAKQYNEQYKNLTMGVKSPDNLLGLSVLDNQPSHNKMVAEKGDKPISDLQMAIDHPTEKKSKVLLFKAHQEAIKRRDASSSESEKAKFDQAAKKYEQLMKAKG